MSNLLVFVQLSIQYPDCRTNVSLRIQLFHVKFSTLKVAVGVQYWYSSTAQLKVENSVQAIVRFSPVIHWTSSILVYSFVQSGFSIFSTDKKVQLNTDLLKHRQEHLYRK
jgi:hypothetical protein